MNNLLKIKFATLLSTKEAETFLTKEERTHRHWWWLRSPGDALTHAAYVYSDGLVNYRGCAAYYADGIVRPALKIDLGSSGFKIGDKFIFGKKLFKIISNDLAFCLEDIGITRFRNDWKAWDANDYEESDVKKFVDKWYEKAIYNSVTAL